MSQIPDDIDSLSRAVLLEVFDEPDAVRRAETIARTFHSDARFIDHFGTHVGHAAINAAVETLHAQLPGFRFAITRDPEALDGAARLAWQFGPPSDPVKITGTDVILIQGGRVSVLLGFIDREPSAAA